ncbi:hypothetical protein PIB30_070846 [Stylosanthes scabra]|uniref:Uncharacterized protein n=1 Tax=Stylosanthes scabra TaxID=79078 RepID=A0ABU6RPF7_9FABA|nr:hypothetical protein [Stylosanthes scabra]
MAKVHQLAQEKLAFQMFLKPGHKEGDNPLFVQPYDAIAQLLKPSLILFYRATLSEFLEGSSVVIVHILSESCYHSFQVRIPGIRDVVVDSPSIPSVGSTHQME